MELSIAAVPLSKARPFIKNWNKKGIGVKLIQSFTHDKKYRYYMPLVKNQKHAPEAPAIVVDAIKKAGYVIEDYMAGLAAKGDRVVKIGKIISKNPEALKAFVNDPRRSGKNEYTVVISAHPYDVIGMSTGREWDNDSCMRIGVEGKFAKRNSGTDGSQVSFLRGDIAEGTLVAYVVNNIESDMEALKNADPESSALIKTRLRKAKNIEAPKARLLIKPFYNEDGHILWRVERKAYGAQIAGFKETVNHWLREVNKNAVNGKYTLAEKLYNDGAGRVSFVGTQDVNHLVGMTKEEMEDYDDLESLASLVLGNSSDLVLRTKFPQNILRAAHYQSPLVFENVLTELCDFMEEKAPPRTWPALVFKMLNCGINPFSLVDNLTHEFAFKDYFTYTEENTKFLDSEDFRVVAPAFDVVWAYLQNKPYVYGQGLANSIYKTAPPLEKEKISTWLESVLLAIYEGKWKAPIPDQVFSKHVFIDSSKFENGFFPVLFEKAIDADFSWINAFKNSSFVRMENVLYTNALTQHILRFGVAEDFANTNNANALFGLMADFKKNETQKEIIRRLLEKTKDHPAHAEWSSWFNLD